ncbi:hypothetical protein SteCoe_4204 [Stentor coeruleus]|uniref:Uncharacterized protein n=1 Tax=Stentor coeruleus TaxID=5963 RepID=A0A1R2CVI1_9CILI|nr:hypothetical protein SteCoe_4204 [Stentor coeruleus]
MILVNLLCLFLLASCLVFSLYSLLSSSWTSFEIDSLVFKHGLMHSIKTPEQYNLADYKCLKVLSCDLAEASELCNLSKKLETAKNIYLGFEVASIFIMIMLIERLVLIMLNKPYGNQKFFLALMWIFPLTKSSGIAAFLIVSNVNIDNSSKSEEVNSENGIYLAFTALSLSIASTITMIIARVYNTNRVIKLNITVPTSKFLNPFLMFLVSQSFYVLSKLYPTSSFNEFTLIKMNLYTVETLDNYHNLPMSCAAGQTCSHSDDSCSIFSSLNSVSNTAFYIESLVYLFGFLWLEAFFHVLFKVNIGTKILNHFYPVLYIIMLIISLIFYIMKSHIQYGAECSIEDFDNGFKLCAELGTTFYIISVVFGSLTMITYQLIYSMFYAQNNFDNENKVMAEPDDLKKPQFDQDMKVKNLDDADNTNADIKSNSGTTVTDGNIIVNECDFCHQQFKPSEAGIADKGKKYHYKCFVLSGN